MQKRKDLRGRLALLFDGAQGWILMAIIGCIVASLAYCVTVTESFIFDLKEGYCRDSWFINKAHCCHSSESCRRWIPWSQAIHPSGTKTLWIDYLIFIGGSLCLATASCFVTLRSRTVVPSHIASTLDENLGADRITTQVINDKDAEQSPILAALSHLSTPARAYYPVAGSGVAEVKVILSGFILHGYLGFRNLMLKTLALALSVASGMSLGKEGPYVHIAACVGNIACRVFPKYDNNDGKRREVLSASAASGVAVAFGAPIGGVLFSLEEVSYYFPPKTLFRTFFCCIVAAISLKFLNPYGTSKIVLFQVRYLTDWQWFELFNFILLGIAGGLAGALFIKASRFWATTFRRISLIKNNPMLEVMLVALLTGVVGFWNRYTKLPVTTLLYELAAPCRTDGSTGLCPGTKEDIPAMIGDLGIAFVVKAFLTIVTFGLKVPGGIYVPSMVCGGLMGRIVGHVSQYLFLRYPNSVLFAECPIDSGPEGCVTPGVYALVAAGATMCGVTRLSVTLAIILFELTGSLDHVLPFSLAVLCAKWTADAVEPLSIYDLLTDMNDYPFLDNKMHPVFDTELGDIAPTSQSSRVIDISTSPLVRTGELRHKLEALQIAGELDGGLPIVRHNVLVGLFPAPDLEFALDQINTEYGEDEDQLCLLDTRNHLGSSQYMTHSWREYDEAGDLDDRTSMSDSLTGEREMSDPTDLTPYIDCSPLALDVHSPMDLVYQCFAKLGLRYVCVTSEGQFAGLVHKKRFVRYVKETQKGRHH